MQHFRELLKEKDSVFGIFSKTNDAFFVEAAGKAGLDFIILDTEHGPNSPREIYPLINAAKLAGIHPVVRVGKIDAAEFQRYLDLDISALQVPQIQSKQDAENVCRFSKFFPHGMRGVCKYVKGADYSLKEKGRYFSEQNQGVNIIHIEGREGIEVLPEIIDMEGIDIFFIGPYDLSQSLGVPGEVNHPRVLAEIEFIVKKCSEKGKYTGIFTDTVATARKYRELGVKYISYSVDVGIFAQACSRIVSEFSENR